MAAFPYGTIHGMIGSIERPAKEGIRAIPGGHNEYIVPTQGGKDVGRSHDTG